MRFRSRSWFVVSLLIVGSTVACTSILGDFQVLPATTPANDSGTPELDTGVPVTDAGGGDADAADTGPVGPQFGATWVAAGQNHTCAVRLGNVYCWGNNDHGQLGYPVITTPRSNKPLKIPNFGAGVGSGKAMVKVFAGGAHSCAIDVDGSLFCWGANDSGQLKLPVTAGPQDQPVKIAIPNQTGVASASLGTSHTCAVLTNGDTLCWGSNVDGQTGVGPPGGSGQAITKVPTVPVAQSLSAGAAHACIVTPSPPGQLWCWGRNTSGEVGGGPDGGIAAPLQVNMPETPFKVSAKSDAHTCLTAGSPQRIYCFGDNSSGQLGIDGGSTASPTPIFTPPAMPQPDLVLVGARVTCARAAPPSSALGCWGSNVHGQLGLGTKDGDRHDHITPVTNLPPLKEHDGAFAVGADHVCAIAKTNNALEPGQVFCWGAGGFGKLGVDLTVVDDSPTPKPVISD